MIYQIRIHGRLDPKWSHWFDDLRLMPQEGEATILEGRIADQAALQGLLMRIHSLGLPLLAVTCKGREGDEIEEIHDDRPSH